MADEIRPEETDPKDEVEEVEEDEEEDEPDERDDEEPKFFTVRRWVAYAIAAAIFAASMALTRMADNWLVISPLRTELAETQKFLDTANQDALDALDAKGTAIEERNTARTERVEAQAQVTDLQTKLDAANAEIETLRTAPKGHGGAAPAAAPSQRWRRR